MKLSHAQNFALSQVVHGGCYTWHRWSGGMAYHMDQDVRVSTIRALLMRGLLRNLNHLDSQGIQAVITDAGKEAVAPYLAERDRLLWKQIKEDTGAPL